MVTKPSKTQQELEALIMEEMNLHIECADVQSVRVMKIGSSWDVLPQGSEGSISCRRRLRVISARLAYDYDLAADCHSVSKSLFRCLGTFRAIQPF